MEYKHPSLLYTGCLVVFSFFFFGEICWVIWVNFYFLFVSLCAVGFFKFGELSYMNRSYFDSFDQNGIKY